MSFKSVIKIKNLSKKYRVSGEWINAVLNVSLCIDAGSIVGLLGPNGSGKSTIIKSILRLVTIDEGSVEIFGRKQKGKNYIKHIGAIIEGKKSVNERLSIEENAKYYCALREVPFDKEFFNYLIEILGLKDEKKAVRYLSTGNQQKASLISVFIHKPQIVLLDEPTLGMDIESTDVFRKLIKRLSRDYRMATLITSHDLNFVEKICDDLICINKGEVIYSGTLKRLREVNKKKKVKLITPYCAGIEMFLARFEASSINVMDTNIECYFESLEKLSTMILCEEELKAGAFDQAQINSVKLEENYLELINESR